MKLFFRAIIKRKFGAITPETEIAPLVADIQPEFSEPIIYLFIQKPFAFPSKFNTTYAVRQYIAFGGIR